MKRGSRGSSANTRRNCAMTRVSAESVTAVSGHSVSKISCLPKR